MNGQLVRFFMMALAPACAFAVDGVTLLNQSTVVAAGGFPYTISQPGSYKLAGNLLVDGGKNGIVITSSNVTLDLNGFTISPRASSLTAVGVLAQNLQTITIRNGAITGFNDSVDLNGTSGVLAEDLIILGTNEMGYGYTNSFFGSNGIIRNVAVLGRGMAVSCPMVVAGVLGQVFQDTTSGICAVVANAH